jgi:lysozyme
VRVQSADGRHSRAGGVGCTAIDLIKRFESLELEAYLCPAGAWTIGWGHTAGVEPGMRITEQHAEELLGLDIE